ncbi:MAG: hypothetical protein Q9218_002495 [Villophora microphyllina]
MAGEDPPIIGSRRLPDNRRKRRSRPDEDNMDLSGSDFLRDTYLRVLALFGEDVSSGDCSVSGDEDNNLPVSTSVTQGGTGDGQTVLAHNGSKPGQAPVKNGHDASDNEQDLVNRFLSRKVVPKSTSMSNPQPKASMPRGLTAPSTYKGVNSLRKDAPVARAPDTVNAKSSNRLNTLEFNNSAKENHSAKTPTPKTSRNSELSEGTSGHDLSNPQVRKITQPSHLDLLSPLKKMGLSKDRYTEKLAEEQKPKLNVRKKDRHYAQNQLSDQYPDIQADGEVVAFTENNALAKQNDLMATDSMDFKDGEIEKSVTSLSAGYPSRNMGHPSFNPGSPLTNPGYPSFTEELNAEAVTANTDMKDASAVPGSTVSSVVNTIQPAVSDNTFDKVLTTKRKNEDDSDDEDLEPSKQPAKKAKLARTPKKAQATEKKPKDTSHLIERPHAPKLNTKPRPKNAQPVPKERVNTRSAKYIREFRTKRDKVCKTGLLVKRCLEAAEKGSNVGSILSDLRNALHALELYDWVDEKLVTESRFNEAFPNIVAHDIFPWDIKSDATALFNKWSMGDLDGHLLHGIIFRRPKDRNIKRGYNMVIEPDYPYVASAAYVGAGVLQNGKWFAYQVCAYRDGAHGAFVDGIFGQNGKGAYSIVMSGSGYNDIDQGDVIKYCGTSGQENAPTAATQRMLETKQNGNPIRVLRSAAMKKEKSPYRPSVGLRYDGLYQIVDSELLDQGTAMHRFTLHRCAGQDPIRYQGVEARPNAHEIKEFGLLKQE